MFSKYDSLSDKMLVICIYLLMILTTITFIYPFWDQLVLSLSTRVDAASTRSG